MEAINKIRPSWNLNSHNTWPLNVSRWNSWTSSSSTYIKYFFKIHAITYNLVLDNYSTWKMLCMNRLVLRKKICKPTDMNLYFHCASCLKLSQKEKKKKRRLTSYCIRGKKELVYTHNTTQEKLRRMLQTTYFILNSSINLRHGE